MAICTAAEYKAWRNIGVTTWDALIATLIAGGQAAVERFTARLFDSAARTQYYSGNGGASFQVNAYPITAITSVALWDQATATAYDTLTANTDYFYDAALGIFYRTNAVRGRVGAMPYGGDGWPIDRGGGVVGWGVSPNWPEGPDNIKIVYTGGYATSPSDLMPSDLKLAFFQYLDQLWVNTWGTGGTLPTGLSSEKIDQYSYVIGDPDRNAVSLQRGMFRTQALLTEFFGGWKRGDTI